MNCIYFDCDSEISLGYLSFSNFHFLTKFIFAKKALNKFRFANVFHEIFVIKLRP